MRLGCDTCDSRNVDLKSTSHGPLIKLQRTCRECGEYVEKEVRPNVDLRHTPTAGVSELRQY